MRQKETQRTIPTIVSLDVLFSMCCIVKSGLGCEREREKECERYVRKSHPEHKSNAELLGLGELKLERLIDREADYDNIHEKVDDAVAQDELVDVKTVAGLLGRPAGPGEVDRLALEDDDEDEEDHDEYVEPNNWVCEAAEDRRGVEDAHEEEAHRELGGRDVDDVEHLVGEEGYQDRGDVGEGHLPRVFAQPKVVYPPEVHAVEGNGE